MSAYQPPRHAEIRTLILAALAAQAVKKKAA